MRYTYEDLIIGQSVMIDQDGSYGGCFKDCEVKMKGGIALRSVFENCKLDITRDEACTLGNGNQFLFCTFSDGEKV